MGELLNMSKNIPIQVKADAYDQLCKAYIEGARMDWSLFGRRKIGYNSLAEYIGYGFHQMAVQQGAIQEEKAVQQVLSV